MIFLSENAMNDHLLKSMIIGHLWGLSNSFRHYFPKR